MYYGPSSNVNDCDKRDQKIAFLDTLNLVPLSHSNLQKNTISNMKKDLLGLLIKYQLYPTMIFYTNVEDLMWRWRFRYEKM